MKNYPYFKDTRLGIVYSEIITFLNVSSLKQDKSKYNYCNYNYYNYLIAAYIVPNLRHIYIAIFLLRMNDNSISSEIN